MTANELAKLIKNTDGALWLEPYLDKIADTLIEQAQEIEELKAQLDLIDDLFAERKEVIRLEAEIEALKKSFDALRSAYISVKWW